MTERWSGEPTEPMPGYGGYGNQPGGGEPTQMMPPGRGPTGTGGPGSFDDELRRRRKRNWLIAAGVLAVVIIVVLVVLLLTSSNSSNGVTISSFTVPSTVNCNSPTTIGVSWSTSNASTVQLSIDGAVFKTYSGSNGSDVVPFACNGRSHTYTLLAQDSSGAHATQTQTVTQISSPTTSSSTTTTTKAPPTSSSTTTTSSTSTTTTT